MVVKLYISGISGNKEVKKKQQRVQMILDSKQITYEAIDITEPGKEKDKEFMQQFGKVRESLGKYPLPPQIFNDDNFCGDYEDFDLANEVDELEKFLHIETKELENGSKVNGLREEVIDTKKPDDESQIVEENHKVNGVEEEENAAEIPPCEDVTEATPEDSSPLNDNEKTDDAPVEEAETNEDKDEKAEENAVQVEDTKAEEEQKEVEEEVEEEEEEMEEESNDEKEQDE